MATPCWPYEKHARAVRNELKNENSEGKGENLIVENLNFRSKKLKVLCHPLQDLVEFAEDDTQQEAMLYMGFVPAKENDNALLLGKAGDQDDLIYSEASFHYTFAFQEYGDKGFIEVLQRLQPLPKLPWLSRHLP